MIIIAQLRELNTDSMKWWIPKPTLPIIIPKTIPDPECSSPHLAIMVLSPEVSHPDLSLACSLKQKGRSKTADKRHKELWALVSRDLAGNTDTFLLDTSLLATFLKPLVLK